MNIKNKINDLNNKEKVNKYDKYESYNRRIVKKLNKIDDKRREARRKWLRHINDGMMGIKTIKTLNLEEKNYEELSNYFNECNKDILIRVHKDGVATFDEILEHNLPENEPGPVLIDHSNDMVWMFGKIYRRSFIDKYKIKFHETSRANEDNGFNAICNLSCKRGAQ